MSYKAMQKQSNGKIYVQNTDIQNVYIQHFYFLQNPQRRRTTVSVLVYIIYSYQYQIMLVTSLTVILSSECYLKTFTSILLTIL